MLKKYVPGELTFPKPLSPLRIMSTGSDCRHYGGRYPVSDRRQEGIFGRPGLASPLSTLTQWVGQSGGHLQPLVDAL